MVACFLQSDRCNAQDGCKRPSLPVTNRIVGEDADATLSTNSALEPAPLDWHHWRRRHAQLSAEASRSSPRVLFLGDSITENWNTVGRLVWEKELMRLGAANFGIAGDRTQSLRWRIREGDYGQMDPEVVVLLIGTNNLKNNRNTAEETAEGILGVVDDCLAAFEQAQIILLSLLPCMRSPKDPHAIGVGVANSMVADICQQPRVRRLDLGDLFLVKGGLVSSAHMPDYLHPNHAGYALMAERLKGVVDDLNLTSRRNRVRLKLPNQD